MNRLKQETLKNISHISLQNYISYVNKKVYKKHTEKQDLITKLKNA